MTRFTPTILDKLKAEGKIRRIKADPPQLIVGIDCGVKTGFAAWSPVDKKFLILETLKIHQAMEKVKMLAERLRLFVRVEDARQVKFKTEGFKAQGAGSVKRDAKIWEDFLEEHGIPFEMVRPAKAITKKNAEDFRKLTGHEEQTSSHARDAAMLVLGY
jgi:hypothetical protein